MVVQAIGLLDELDKELNTYAMRVREWYGWHFPELTKIISDNYAYAKAAKLMGDRANAANIDFSGIDTIDEDVENEIKDASVISMGTEIAPTDLDNIGQLADQVISLSDRKNIYRNPEWLWSTPRNPPGSLLGSMVGYWARP